MTALPGPMDLARAEAMGRLAARRRLGVDACPFEANGTPREQVLALRFVRAFLGAGGTLHVDYDDGHHDRPGGVRVTIRRST